MAKRFTDTDKWDDDWFLGLPPEMKCVWEYLRDTCDGVGIKKISLNKISALVGAKISKENLNQFFESRIHWVNHETVWVHGFIKAQYKRLSPNSNAHVNIAKKAIELVDGQSLSDKAFEVLSYLKNFLNDLSGGRPGVERPSPEGQPTDIGNRIKNKGNKKEECEEKTIETASQQNDPIAFKAEPSSVDNFEARFRVEECRQIEAMLGQLYENHVPPDIVRIVPRILTAYKSVEGFQAYATELFNSEPVRKKQDRWRSYLSVAIKRQAGLTG